MRPQPDKLRKLMHAFVMRTPQGQRGWEARANAILPGGVNSPVRAWNAVGGQSLPIASANGAIVTDAAGGAYVDLVGSWGAAIAGHANPKVVSAVTRAAKRGLSFGATTEAEVELAELIRDRYAPAERVRLVSTGTEATMTALRLARGATGRDVVIKFAGHYHGHADPFLVAAGSGLATAGAPDSAGVTASTAADTMVLPYGDVDALTGAFAQHGERIAAVIAEGAPCNMGVVRPPDGFNRLIGELTRNEGAVFILDEVLTGFRAGPAGWWGIERDVALAKGEQPWVPDLVTFGKVIGGGLPVASVAGRADLMEQLAPLGPVYQAGTLSGNPVAVAAGLATLDIMDADAYATLARAADEVREGVHEALLASGVTHAVGRAGTLFSFFLGLDEPPVTFADAARQDTGLFRSLFRHMRAEGVSLPPSAFEAWFVSIAHESPITRQIVDAAGSWRPNERANP
ncbi:glutamate-1-semialdehyde 2,1-aminomutase [Demequina lutea]|uniref:Glutamate-1-semialdehyde 2,1-aminomutase n=2 Tax=Demequina lutea TaxID=431489 RepID=A0A7Z0CH11_9MICO|nr:glutamate-1-semialdehyde 2,1-aminomutase [Demequina lutea]NYI41026.1 glutamate-1-semialdehyde 2,1-aminomutase [Demequina lutea]